MEQPLSHEEFVRKLLSNPQVAAEYERMETEFSLLREMLLARKAAGMTQAQVAQAMGTRQASIARLESGLARGRLPSLSMLKRYADAVGCKLHIRMAA